MGTEYNLYNDDSFGELTIDEMSNKLSFNLTHHHISEGIISSVDMTPEEMAKIFLKGLTICSYWMDTDELKEMIRYHTDREIW